MPSVHNDAIDWWSCSTSYPDKGWCFLAVIASHYLSCGYSEVVHTLYYMYTTQYIIKCISNMYSYEQDYYTIAYWIQCNTGGQITQFCKVYEPSKLNVDAINWSIIKTARIGGLLKVYPFNEILGSCTPSSVHLLADQSTCLACLLRHTWEQMNNLY